MSVFTGPVHSALAKLFHCTTKDFIPTPSRKRENIKRSHYSVKRDGRYKSGKNDDFIRFCRCTGLRRREVTALKGNALREENGKYYIAVRGKGGRNRVSEIIGSDEDINFVISVMKKAGE